MFGRQATMLDSWTATTHDTRPPPSGVGRRGSGGRAGCCSWWPYRSWPSGWRPDTDSSWQPGWHSPRSVWTWSPHLPRPLAKSPRSAPTTSLTPAGPHRCAAGCGGPTDRRRAGCRMCRTGRTAAVRSRGPAGRHGPALREGCRRV